MAFTIYNCTMPKQKKAVSPTKITSVIAREGNGNIQITFTVPFDLVSIAKDETLKEMAADVEIPGFRKGKAPIERVKENIPENKVIEHALSHLLPEALTDVVKENNLKLVIYPKFELISADENKDWQIRAISCELPPIELGDYKKAISGALRSQSIITPQSVKAAGTKSPEQERAEREQTVIKSLIENTKVDIPEILVREEADSRISGLLEKIEKLGLTLDGYLASIHKTAEDLRAEYAHQAKDAIALDLILTEIADAEDVKVDPNDVDNAMNISSASKIEDGANNQEQRRLIESILRRRKALDFLVSLS